MDEKNVYCKKIEYIGINRKKETLSVALKRNFSLTRCKTKYNIEITMALNTKSVLIEAGDIVKEEAIFELLCSILQFECIYDGCFFSPDKILVDGDDRINSYHDIMLSFYSGSSVYCHIQQPLDDKIYKKGFSAWEKFNKRNMFLTNLFFYVSFTNGITSDLRMALFSEIFEPLSIVLEDEGKIVIDNPAPFKTKKISCPKCQNEYEVKINCKISLYDRIKAVINEFGETIFEDDDVETIIRKMVKTRNRVLHVDEEKKGFLTGRECGFYLKKLVILFRLIVLMECDVFDYGEWQQTIDQIHYFNENFAQCRIRSTDRR